jgi:hypothetical protein
VTRSERANLFNNVNNIGNRKQTEEGRHMVPVMCNFVPIATAFEKCKRSDS